MNFEKAKEMSCCSPMNSIVDQLYCFANRMGVET